MIAAELSVVGGKHAGQVIPLNRRKFLIGREQDCQLRPNSEMVSRHHCVFSLDDFSVRLRDLGSTNGTFVNGSKILKETVLTSGDHVVIGNLEFQFQILPGTAVDSAVSNSGFDLRTKPEDTQVTSQTVLEIPVAQPQGGYQVASTSESPETTQIPAPAQQQIPAGGMMPGSPGMEMAGMHQPQQMMPPQFAYPQQMMQPMPFPGGMYGGYPYQHMVPQYGQMYPAMMSPQMGGYPAPQGQPQQQTATAPANEVLLPDPDSTGAREEVAKGSSGANPKDTEKPTGAADAILKQLSSRRPAT